MLNEFVRQLTGIELKNKKTGNSSKRKSGKQSSPGINAVTETNKALVKMLKSAHK